MVTRTPGPFQYFPDKFNGATGTTIRASIDPVDSNASKLHALAGQLRGDEQRIAQTVEGDILAPIQQAPAQSASAADRLAGKAIFANGCLRKFAGYVDDFDTTVDSLNTRYKNQVFTAQHDPDVKQGTISLTDLQGEFRAALQPEYQSAENTLDNQADEVSADLKSGPTDDSVLALIRAGLIPLSAASFFPSLPLTPADIDKAKQAQVDQSILRLRDEGLLGQDQKVEGNYRKWLENAANSGVSIDEILKIAREQKITPDSFNVLNNLEEIKDPDGKSFFLLPPNISGDDARRAVLMTYILNARTDYGSAHDQTGTSNDYAETPYSAAEVQRIADRQAKNSWTYNDDVSFVHGNSGRLVTTPNGMLMGAGGNWVQDKYSQGGGTTWGDTFMLNIDDPTDEGAAEALRQTVRSGLATYEDSNTHQLFQGPLDLDRLLHHEERHSQQWAEKGYAKMLGTYGAEILKGHVDKHGNENPLERDAGLEDGGYQP